MKYVLLIYQGTAWEGISVHQRSRNEPAVWFAASLENAAAATLGLVGLAVLRRRGGLTSSQHPHPAQLPLRSALRHPVAITMITGNAVILAISLAQL